mmetsp:Transcript_28653/g.42209  ORF Transcript_28653/g.42209 Transcript_28653/m.42209 type:complete len:433 (-) Transcript_28653:506-1804(-)
MRRRVPYDSHNLFDGSTERNIATLAGTSSLFYDCLERLHGFDSMWIKTTGIVGRNLKKVYRITLARKRRIGCAILFTFRIGRLKLAQFLIKVFRNKGSEGSHQNSNIQQDIVQDLKARFCFTFGTLALSFETLQTITIETDIPISKLRNVGNQLGHDSIQTIGLHFFMNKLNQSLCCSTNPNIGRIRRGQYLFLGRTKLVVVASVILRKFQSFHILQKETKGIVPGQKDFLHNTQNTSFPKFERFRSYDRTVDKIHTQCVCTILVNDQIWIRIILFALGHFLSIFCQYQSINNEVLKGGFPKQGCTQNHERIEPSTCLIQPFCNKVGGETLFEPFLVFKGIMLLCVGHRTRFKPTIKDFINTTQHDTRCLLRWNFHLINRFTMQIFHLCTRQCCQLFDTTNTNNFLHIWCCPNRNGCTPESIPTDSPISCFC